MEKLQDFTRPLGEKHLPAHVSLEEWAEKPGTQLERQRPLQKEALVTEVTPVSAAALQALPRAGYQRQDTSNQAGQRHRRQRRPPVTKNKE